MCNIHAMSIPFSKCNSYAERQFACQIISNVLFGLCLVCLGNPLHSTALEDESRPETDHRNTATTGKQTGKGRGNEVQAVTETPKRPGRAAKNLKPQQEQTQKKTSSESKRNQKTPAQIDHAPKSQYFLQNIYIYIYS